MDINTLRGIITLLLILVFIGIVIYAWSRKNKARFDEAAMLPLNEPNEPNEAKHG
ncbi:cbb3-type cytochrome c oxidase subunit 3 [Lautropia dentalis]|jgi:ccoQ|uniref:Cbb3-type cytochrome c oxidase subunit 3 n=1 Tax=Lautropia dentalis TaxID=2490857 RepID=A0A3R8MR24_9BURK|nr:cbb3-type cytochrome c oxidase subunit 3 [Lautropia dentalis]RRN44498.1 cbb3-type cytochrome c oxidase subunit 3 [Lautropia dentalis]